MVNLHLFALERTHTKGQRAQEQAAGESAGEVGPRHSCPASHHSERTNGTPQASVRQASTGNGTGSSASTSGESSTARSTQDPCSGQQGAEAGTPSSHLRPDVLTFMPVLSAVTVQLAHAALGCVRILDAQVLAVTGEWVAELQACRPYLPQFNRADLHHRYLSPECVYSNAMFM